MTRDSRWATKSFCAPSKRARRRITSMALKRAGFGLDDCAVSTIAKWKFKPGEKDGKPVAVFATVEVNFRLL